MHLDDDELKDVFVAALGIEAAQFGDDLELGGIDKWDSLSHFDLVSAIESKFDIRFTTEEIQEVLSVRAIKEALAKK